MTPPNVTIDGKGRKHFRHTTEGRTCYRCAQYKPNEAFTWRANGKPFSACKACNLIMAREYRAARKARVES
jgi:hypothetical protein